MRRISALLSVAAVVLWTVGAYAQAKPDFSGKWVREAPAGGAAAGGGGGGRGGGGGGFGMENTITQNAKTLTIEYTQGQNPVKLVFNLDGSPSTNKVMGRGGEAMDQVSKATWDGSKISITTTTANGEVKRVISMEGANMVVESTVPGREGGAPQTSKAVYKKA
ncbi:MAG: hypothetical protein ACM4AI_27300 [Acidobacteriota bacterium]